MDRSQIDRVVARLIAEMFDQEPEDIRATTSLLDDLAAESIDFVDLTFRLEEAFDLKLRQDHVYQGTLNLVENGYVVDGKVSEAGMRLIRERMPDYDLSRFPDEVLRASDLPRLVTVGTVSGYIAERLAEAE